MVPCGRSPRKLTQVVLILFELSLDPGVVPLVDRQRQEEVGAGGKQEPFRKEGPPGVLGCWSIGGRWYTLVYQGHRGVVAGNSGREIGRNQPRQGVYAVPRSLDCIHQGFHG